MTARRFNWLYPEVMRHGLSISATAFKITIAAHRGFSGLFYETP